jgi:hypothetical protein
MRKTMSAKCGGLIVLMLLLPMSPPLTARADAYDVLSGLVGHSKAELIQRLGPPSDTITTIGGERLIYETLDAGRIGGISGRDSRAGGADDFRSLSRSYAFRCKTEVVIAEGRVRAFNRSGNDCR